MNRWMHNNPTQTVVYAVLALIFVGLVLPAILLAI